MPNELMRNPGVLKWELISHENLVETLALMKPAVSYRAKVPGGWLVLTYMGGPSMAYVHDPTYEWERGPIR